MRGETAVRLDGFDLACGFEANRENTLMPVLVFRWMAAFFSLLRRRKARASRISRIP